MGEVGFEMLKDIPGFQAILKTLVKGQLQHLINQLSEHGDSETLVLSVNRSDGTIQQLGSRKGEEFLGFRHDLKSQFLKYCLQSYQPHETSANTLVTEEVLDSQSQSHDLDLSHDHSVSHDHSAVGHHENLSVPNSKRSNFKRKKSRHTGTETNNRGKISDKEMQNEQIEEKLSKETFEKLDAPVTSVVKEEPLSPEYDDTGDVSALKVGEAVEVNNPSLSESMNLEMDMEAFSENFFSMTRTRIRPKQIFKCQKCGKLFKNAQNLKVHDRKHSGIRPYGCEFCSQRFYQQSHLRCHVRTHTGEKPYECQHCGQRFTQSSSMHSHIRLQHFVSTPGAQSS